MAGDDPHADMGTRVSKASVNYRVASPVSSECCAACSMFRESPVRRDGAVGTCTLVEGLIEGGYVCDEFSPR